MAASDVEKRLKNIQGQLTGIASMISEKRDCLDVLPQLKASKAGLEKCIALYLEQEMTSCFKMTKSSKSQQKKLHALLLELSKA